MQELFAAYDKDKSGTISFEELADGLRGQGYVVNESEVRPLTLLAYLWFRLPGVCVVSLQFWSGFSVCMLRYVVDEAAVRRCCKSQRSLWPCHAELNNRQVDRFCDVLC